jgi:hypothetical protein
LSDLIAYDKDYYAKYNAMWDRCARAVQAHQRYGADAKLWHWHNVNAGPIQAGQIVFYEPVRVARAPYWKPVPSGVRAWLRGIWEACR